MKIALALIIMLALASATVGDTFASFCDSETSFDNYIETGSLDLKVAKVDESWQGSDFRDDEPWGYGLDCCFFVPEITQHKTYTCNLLLWNAGTEDGIAGLHLKIVNAPENCAELTDVDIWYDTNGSETEDAGDFVMSGTLAELNCEPIDLGLLPAEVVQRFCLQVTPHWAHSQQNELVFDTLFSLVDECLAFSDTEECRSFLDPNPGEMGGTPGFWRSPGAVEWYGKSDIVSWFKTIVAASAWYEDDLADGSDDEVYDKMVDILKNVGAAEYAGMVNQFRAQYLATRLNTMPDPPRLQLGTTHDISDIDGAETYFGYATRTLAQIITFIESEDAGGIFTEPPSRPNMKIMKNVCDYLNNP